MQVGTRKQLTKKGSWLAKM